MPKTNYKKIINIVISLSYVLFSFLLAVHFWSFNESFYESEHNRLKLYGKSIAEHIGISNEDLKELTSFTLNYLNDPDASLDIQMVVNGELREIFTDDEKLHMVDVRKLNLTANYLLIISGIVFSVLMIYLIYKKDLNDLYYTYRKVLFYAGIVIGVLGLWIVIDFDSFWTMFHHIFFSGNDLWLLDLRKDILIMIVPPEFFFHLVTIIVISFVALLVVFYMILKSLNGRKVRND